MAPASAAARTARAGRGRAARFVGAADRRDEGAVARRRRRVRGGALGARRRSRDAESPIGRYAGALALLVLGDDVEARIVGSTLRDRDDFPPAVADAIVELAGADRVDYLIALEDILESFEQRTDFLEDVPVADTVLVLQRLAARRGLAVELPTPRRCLPKAMRRPRRRARRSSCRARAHEAARRLRDGSPRTRASPPSALSSPVTRNSTSRALAQHGQRQRDAVDERLEASPRRRRRAARSRRASAASGKSDATCPSGPSPSRTRSKRSSAAELAARTASAPCLAPELAAHAVHRARGDAVEQRVPSPCRSSSARRRAERSARRPTRSRRRSSRARARPRARTRARGVEPPVSDDVAAAPRRSGEPLRGFLRGVPATTISMSR